MPAAEGVDRGGYVRGRAGELTEMAKGRFFFFMRRMVGKLCFHSSLFFHRALRSQTDPKGQGPSAAGAGCARPRQGELRRDGRREREMKKKETLVTR